MEFEKCRDILLREHEAVAQAVALQKLIEKAALSREWALFDTRMTELNGYCAGLSELEREREALFSTALQKPDAVCPQTVALAGGDTGRFYTLAMRFEPRQRSELGDIYRSLKLEALKLRLANDALLKYLNEFKTTMNGFFEMAFPDRGGKMYTPWGKPVSHDMRSLVVNQSM